MDRLERYIFGQAGPSIYTYLATHTVQQFLDEVKKAGAKINPKQQNLVDLFQDKKTDDWEYKRDNGLMLERWKKIYEREAKLHQYEDSLKAVFEAMGIEFPELED